MGRSRFRKGRVLNSNWKDIIHFDSVIGINRNFEGLVLVSDK
jgi:hypothetical protein